MISRILGVLTLICFFFVWSAGTAFAYRRVALVIGNSAYKNVTPLPNPAHDAAAIAAMLEKAGFDVVMNRTDLGNVAIRRALREFARRALKADIAVVYYAGHGIEVDGTNYLIPVDAELASDLDVEDETVSLDRIVRILEPVRRLRLIILDACREDPFSRKMTRTLATRSIGRGLAKVEVTGTDTLIAFAAKAGMTAEDGDGSHSPFTTALLDNLAIPGLDLRIAFGRVRDEVMKNTDNKQEPYVYGSIGGSTVALVPKAKAPVAAAKPTKAGEPLNDAIARDYEFAERIGTKEAWQSFLHAHNAGLYADLARAARDKIIAAEKQQKLGAAPERKSAPPPSAPIMVANAPTASASANDRSLGPAFDPGDVARLLQFHLKRIGCDPGEVDGKWTEQSVHAMQEFNKRTRAKLNVKVASLAALESVRQHKARVCPLVCGRGFKAEGDHCVAVVCRRGYERNKAGECERKVRNVAARAAKHEERGGGQVFCDRGGCRSVPKNCRIVYSQGGAGGGPGGPQASALAAHMSCN